MADQVLTDTFFEQFDLHPTLARGLADCGFTRCTPIQALTLPVALTGRDVAGQAQTGTGKTAAFLVAVFNRLLTRPALAERRPEDPRALILAPTRELAIQIEKDARAIGRHTGLRLALIYGGTDYDRQRELLKGGCDVIIATPGRLIDYYKQQVFTLRAVDAMVVDEADRMFDLGFIKDIYFLFRRLPPREQRQSMLFSATLSHRVLELAYEHMNEPEKLAVESDNITADRVRQVVYFPAKEEKLPLLLNLLERAGAARSIVFVNTKIAAERVAERLQKQGILAGTLSGDVPQKKREKLLARFQRGEMEALVATDVAARGLHIEGVSHVFNYDLPQDAEDYVHRIGRTARLGAEGDAVSFACDLYAMSLPDIETYIGQKIPAATVTPDLLLSPKPRRSAAQAAAHAAIDDAAEGDAGAPYAAETRARPSRRKRGSHERGTSSAARTPAARVASGATSQPAPQPAA
ncbi:DEAD/DEAH box helicase, partial [Metallibacterium scheffleri]|uniref:DEAD/DEAH box helicase n=2 Tax=Metallibacterium TaxID=1218803 RepID=UPI0026E9E70C